MGRTKKLLLVSIGCAGVTIALLLAVAVSVHLLANRDLVKSYIVTKIDRMTGGRLDYERIAVDYLPIPHLVARDVHLSQPEVFDLHARQLSVYPRLLAMLSGRLSIRRLTVNAPTIQVHMPRAPDTDHPEKKTDDGGVASLSASIEGRIKSVWGMSAVIDPGTQVEIDQGKATLIFPDAPDIQIREIRTMAERTGKGLSLDLYCSSPLVREMAVHTTVDIAGSQATGTIALADINLRPILHHALPVGITVNNTQANGDLDFSVSETGQARCLFRFLLPSLAIERNNRTLELTATTLAGELGYLNRKLSLRLDTIAVQQPALNFTASAILEQDKKTSGVNLRLDAAAEQLDVDVAGDVTRAIAGDLPSIRTAFGVARAGLLTAPTYSALLRHDQARWRLDKMKATGHLSKGRVTIPGIEADVENITGDIVYEDDHVDFHDLSGLFKGATLKGVDAAINWAGQATLSISASSVDVDAPPFFSWLTGFEELAGAKQYVSAIHGRAAVFELDINGPLTQPGQWDFNFTGVPQDLVVETPHAPFEVNLSGGEIAYRPGSTRSTNLGIQFLDASFVASHQLQGIVDPQSIGLQVDGSVGPEAFAWLSTMLPIPDHLQIKPPVSLSGVSLAWNRSEAITISGEGETAGGVVLTVDVTRSPEILQIRRIHFSDGASNATMSANRRGASIEFNFSGNVKKQTADRLLNTNRILSGSIEGDFQARFNTDARLNSSFIGRLNGNGLHILDLVPVPITADTFSIVGYGNRLDILPSELTVQDTRLRVGGRIDLRDNALAYDIDVDSDQLDADRIRSLFPVEEENDPAGKKKAPPTVVTKGTIHLKTDALTYGGFTWSPVEADIRIDAGTARIMVRQAELCGISTTGELDITPQGIGINIYPMAENASLQETTDCMWEKPISIDARYDLAGNIQLAPTRKNPSQSLSGQITIASQNGRIRHANTLMKIFAMLNITEIFTGGTSDLAEDGYGYTEAWVKAAIADGKLHLNEILLDGNSLKITGQGSIDLKDTTADIVLLAAPLKTVDRIVNKIPVVSYITGGTLVSIPLRVHGELNDLSVTPLRPAAVGKGLLNFMERTLETPFRLVENAGKGTSSQEQGRENGAQGAATPRAP